MYRLATGIFILSTAMIAGCAHSPSTQTTEAEDSFPEGPGVIKEHLSESDTKKMAGCKNEAAIGNRIKRWVCKPAKDDRDMLWVITSQ